MDHKPLASTPRPKKRKEELHREPRENDDIAGMIISAGSSINAREMIIIWLWYLIIHTDVFVERFISLTPGSCDEENSLTMMGTIWSSIIMILGVVIIDMVYR